MIYTIDNKTYKTKAAIKRDFQLIYDKYLATVFNVRKWNAKETAWFVDLILMYHREADRKLRLPVKHILQKRKRDYKSAEIFIVYDDGTEKIVGMHNLWTQLDADLIQIKHRLFGIACRLAVNEYKNEFRAEQFKNTVKWKGITLFNNPTTHVDHVGEYEFQDIVQEFKNEIGPDWINLNVVSTPYGKVFEDAEVEAAFYILHEELAELELVPAEYNLSR